MASDHHTVVSDRGTASSDGDSFVEARPWEFHGPGWHYEADTPVVDGKYIDRATGEVRTACDGGHQEYMGPPSVRILIRSQHEGTTGCAFRAARPHRMKKLLCHIMKIIEKKDLDVDSITATKYTIRIILEHDLTKDEFREISTDMALGL